MNCRCNFVFPFYSRREEIAPNRAKIKGLSGDIINIMQTPVNAIHSFNRTALNQANTVYLPTFGAVSATPPIPAVPISDVEAKTNIVFAALRELGPVPFVRISHIAPLLGLTDSGLRKYCPQCSKLKNWRGDYRFQLDDAEHIAALRALITLVLWSGRKLPFDLQVSSVSDLGARKSDYLH